MSAIEDNINRISKDQWSYGYQQGRTDAIDEFASRLLCLVSNKCKFISTKEYTYYALEQEEIDNLIYMLAEQLKEQKND